MSIKKNVLILALALSFGAQSAVSALTDTECYQYAQKALAKNQADRAAYITDLDLMPEEQEQFDACVTAIEEVEKRLSGDSKRLVSMILGTLAGVGIGGATNVVIQFCDGTVNNKLAAINSIVLLTIAFRIARQIESSADEIATLKRDAVAALVAKDSKTYESKMGKLSQTAAADALKKYLPRGIAGLGAALLLLTIYCGGKEKEISSYISLPGR